jgi:NAD(P)H-hydrate epimerase
MQLLATSDQMRSFDRSTIERLRLPGIVLMENAGRECVRALAGACDVRGRRVAVVCGRGNNGGDGFVIARHLSEIASNVHVLLLGSPAGLRGDALAHFRTLRVFAGRSSGRLSVKAVRSARALSAVPFPDVVVDAVVGTGFAGDVRGLPAAGIDWINRSGAFILAVDLPSGVDASTGRAGAAAVRADLTVTFAAPKIGHFVGAGADLSGRVEVAQIGIPAAVMKTPRDPVYRAGTDDVVALLPTPKRTAHKYSVGKVLMLGGSRNFTGAPALSAEGALRAGCGAVVLGVPDPAHRIVAQKVAEVIVHPLADTASGTLARSAIKWVRERIAWADVLALGPGMGRDPDTDALVVETVLEAECPVVLDADGLTAFSGRLQALRQRKRPTVLTPHAGELARLSGVASDLIESDRVRHARDAAKRSGCVIVLKGAPTVSAEPSGRVVVNATGNPGMATIGSGDVLTGVIASLIAQGVPAADAGWAGAYLHGLAGDLARERYGARGMLASDILAAVPAALEAVRRL